MRRIPWLALAVLAGLLVVTLPLASAEPLPASTYLQLVPLVRLDPSPTPRPPQPRVDPKTLVVRPVDFPGRGYAFVSEGVLTSAAAAAAFADPAAALAAFAAQGRESAYQYAGSGYAGYTNAVTRYTTSAGATAGLDMVFDAAPVPPQAGCSDWEAYVLEGPHGDQVRAKQHICVSGRLGFASTFVIVAVRQGTYVSTVEFVTAGAIPDSVLVNEFATAAAAKLP
jgi:hypothetical protein